MVDTSQPSGRQDLAAELALGLLDGPERAEALRLCLSDPAFAAEVEAWQHRLSPLLDAVPGDAPPDYLWPAIAARIGDAPARGTVRALRLWRGGALVAGTVAAALALVLITRPMNAPETIGISQLAGQNAASMAISYDPHRGLLRLTSSGLHKGDKSPELWVIPEDGVPRSLGIIPADGDALPVNAGLRQFLRDGATLAITLEDTNTAPHRAPSSTPILTGKISII